MPTVELTSDRSSEETSLRSGDPRDADQYPGVARATVHDWLPHLEAALTAGGQDPNHVEAQATLALAIVRGLLLDRSATGEAARVRTAYQALAGL